MYKLKKIIIIFLFFIISQEKGYSQWNIVYSDTINTINDIFCLDSNKCWVAGTNGLLKKTIDGGNNWISLQLDTNKSYSSLYFLNDTIGFLVSSPPDPVGILKTIDGGVSWVTNFPSNTCTTSFGIGQCYAFNEDTALFLAGCNTLDFSLNSTFDSGLSLNKISLLPPCIQSSQIYLQRMLFINDSVGYAVGDNEGLYKTIDKGINWTKIHSACTGNGDIDVFGMSFYNDTVAWFGGYKPNSFYGLKFSVDAGITWTSFMDSRFYFVNDVAFFPDGNGFVTTGPDIYKTNDYGATFSFQYNLYNPTPVHPNLVYKFFFLNSHNGYAASMHSILKTTNGGGSVGIYEKNEPSLIKLFPNPSSGEFTVSKFELAHGLWDIQLFNNLGQEIMQFSNIIANEIDINLSNYPAGVYFVKSNFANKFSVSKIIISK